MNAITTWDEVPLFDTEDAEAAFWEVNRIEVRLMESSVASAQEPTESITISLRMDPRMLARLKRLARSRYLNYQSMMKQWLSERLEEEFRDRQPEEAVVRGRVAAFRGRTSAAFTLIELLVVIAIIGVLAAMVVGLAAVAKGKRIEGRAKVELRQLETAIESYRSDFNTYPPDRLLPAGSPFKVDPVRNPLFFELRGTTVDAQGQFRVPGDNEFWTSDQIFTLFGRKGFRNATANADEPRRSYVELREAQVRDVTLDGVRSKAIVVAAPWPREVPNPLLAGVPNPPPVVQALNPWRYVSTGPTNNPAGFDLWAEVYVGKERKVIANFAPRP
ncbi:MAG: CopG family antitoxin [Limisphaerales bacterium]